MIRLSRAGRESAIIDAIKKLRSRGKYQSFTQGEICRQMGITSQSKIRDILLSMCDDGRLACGASAIDGYNHEVNIYSLGFTETKPMMPVSYGTYINGHWVEMSGEELSNVAV